MTLDQFSNLIADSSTIWTAGITTVALIFTALQAFFVYRTLVLAEKYLPIHRSKVKEEKSVNLVIATKEKIALYRILSNKLFSIPSELIDSLDDDMYESSKLIDKYFTMYEEQRSSLDVRLAELSSEISTGLTLLKMDDLVTSWQKVTFIAYEIEMKFQFCRQQVAQTSLGQLKIESFKSLPRSFSLGTHELNLTAMLHLVSIDKELINLYRK